MSTDRKGKERKGTLLGILKRCKERGLKGKAWTSALESAIFGGLAQGRVQVVLDRMAACNLFIACIFVSEHL
eukprot:1158893-Pelagomonas_calceolata.AAC.21